MSKYCPIENRTIVYLDCLDCENKACRMQGTGETLFNLLRKIRLQHGDVLYDMAKKLGCSPAALSQAEHGNRPFPDEWIESLREAYGLEEETVQKIRELTNRSQ